MTSYKHNEFYKTIPHTRVRFAQYVVKRHPRVTSINFQYREGNIVLILNLREQFIFSRIGLARDVARICPYFNVVIDKIYLKDGNEYIGNYIVHKLDLY